MMGAMIKLSHQNTILIFGGSFDPPHLGHLNTALKVQRHFHFDQFIFLPCKKPVLKSANVATAAERLDMLKLMLSPYPNFTISTAEIDRNSPSYMFETLKFYRNELGKKCAITLLLGADAYFGFEKWYEWQQIAKLCNMLILYRQDNRLYAQSIPNNYGFHFCEDADALLHHTHGKIAFFDAGDFPISSTSIRYKIKNGLDVESHLTKEVADYIRIHKLYR